MKKTFLILMLIVFCFVGCAESGNKIAKDDGIFSQYDGNYIVINYSGGKIMDVWKLNGIYVLSEENLDSWCFCINDTVIMLNGDAKIIRDDDNKISSKYVEYHYEFNGVDYYTYANKILKKKK